MAATANGRRVRGLRPRPPLARARRLKLARKDPRRKRR
jgi:hypothetical protein